MKFSRDGRGQMGAARPYAGPLYLQIGELLRERIRSRGWVEGQALPNEGELAREYGVSVGTMRKALEQVEAIGWISRRQGRGTFVTNPEAAAAKRLNPFYDDNGKHVLPNSVAMKSISTRVAAADEARWLALEAGETVTSIIAVRMEAGVLAIHDDLAIPTRLAPGIVEELTADPGKFSTFRSDHNLVATRVREFVTAAALPEDVAAALGQEAGIPVLSTSRVSFDADGVATDLCVRHAVLQAAGYSLDLG